ncbi:phosphoribosylaminoimidazolesuccinocarboxamide synthase [Flavobacteriaceae bacterium]|jgi:phosphoribosylaminoimidazole-succinocarboxamide synthase|nr:phosphoribosylaminoimidazolesuccinocarboxamide synthase [Flavobacteriaceae bacterium]MDA9067578.1 phosphoribosylaminoimidazolesuccinocarboxamide synthase [Flavobacteriaceae bacterium]MDB4134801.1 phosphoribosylaminoimidazolesuccinocarboxamide synthase [Flavobacteriaceae bacterium]MDB4213225.1 phosphoribosylaminoimidazolesuccinocarboxamide synthase [Flavobacteriaceae bacterium]MDC0552090.1 phosphoribosylaminoimidazolesuccinocarboxamide synthase [Flavobacteriaceae bacterium]
MNSTIIKTDFNFKNQISVYKGKVRDVYKLKNNLLVMVASDRLSAFDVVMPKGIPFKGQILNQIATKMMRDTEDIVPNWLISTPDPNIAIGHSCEPFKVEMVIRGYLSGHAAREYKTGKRLICGVEMPDGMIENDKFPFPIITPATKAEFGEHDEDISKEDIISKAIVSKSDYEILEDYTFKLFERGSKIAKERGLILVDTKYEFGKTVNGEIVLIDEIHTPDSSRYFYKDGYESRQQKAEPQKQLSKEFVRQWLIKNNFQGLENQTVPIMSDDYVNLVSDRYIELYENITAEKFIKSDTSSIVDRIQTNVDRFLNSHG